MASLQIEVNEGAVPARVPPAILRTPRVLGGSFLGGLSLDPRRRGRGRPSPRSGFRSSPVGGVTFFAPSSLPGFTFTRASEATDGAPETGLPINDVDTYGVDVVRDVSAKIGEPGWTLLEGASTNQILHSGEITTSRTPWGVTVGSVTSVRNESDPTGGTNASRLSAGAGVNNLLQDRSVTFGASRAHSLYVRKGPGSGVYQWLVTNPTDTVGGTAGESWSRTRTITVPTANGIQLRVVDTSTAGDIAAGARDYVAWGAQVEESMVFCSSMIPTTTIAAARAAEDFRFTPTSDWYDGSKVIVLEWIPSMSSTEMNANGTHVSNNPFLWYANSATYIRMLNGSPGTSGASIRVAWSGGLTSEGFIPWEKGDRLRFELHVSRGEVRIFLNGVFQRVRSLPLQQADYVPGSGGWRIGGSWTGSTSMAPGLFRIGTVAAPSEPSVSWDDLTVSSAFTRASVATDGAPEVGLPAGDVDAYAIDQIRDVSAKVGAPGWVLLEGARTNFFRNNAASIVADSAPIVGSVTDPEGGTASVAEITSAPVGTSRLRSVTRASGDLTSGGTSAISAFALLSAPVVDGAISLRNRDGVAAGTAVVSAPAGTWVRRQGIASNGAGAQAPYIGLFRNGGSGTTLGSLYRPQLEDGAGFASSMIPGSSDGTTRAADFLTKNAGSLDALEGQKIVIQWRPQRASTEPADSTNNWLFRTNAGRGVYVSGTTNTIGIVTTSTTYVSSYGLVFNRGDLVEITIDVANGLCTSRVNGVVQRASRIIAGTFGLTGASVFVGSSGADSHCFGLFRFGSIPDSTPSPLS